MTGNDPYSPGPQYGPQHGQSVPSGPQQYDQYGRPLPRNTDPYAQHRPDAAPAYGQAPQSAPMPPAPGQAPGGAYPGGPLSLPDETSIYVYGETPEGYTQIAPAVPGPAAAPRGTVYRAGQPVDADPHAAAYAVPARPLTWQELLRGLVTHPLATLDRARDQAFWWPALIISAVCGVLAMVANDQARKELVTTTLSTSFPAMLITALLVPAFMVVLGWVSDMLARTFGGNGQTGPMITLTVLAAWLADAPRLVVSLFASDGSGVALGVGLASFALSGFLLTVAAQCVHELPWPKALGSVSVQLIALLLVLKLPMG
ncbi:Yip1 family protein [Yinghuangia soli]|uniref:YIP1 family protein n=1 Tax=Yinghuangia soli TaxID=2908204 RepID=A0AA41PVI0_9ACTN|nr:Yip1 family protein [Yinghuangia soli]MCF2526639.1 YIP1 family protein [Yinghuangia soli]